MPEFQTSNITIESKKRTIETGIGRTYFNQLNEEMAIIATSTAEISSFAMIVAVVSL